MFADESRGACHRLSNPLRPTAVEPCLKRRVYRRNSAIDMHQNVPGTVPHASLRSAALSAVRWTGARHALEEGARLLVFLALARLLSPAVYGQMAIIGMALALGNLLVEGGFGRALVQRHLVSRAHLDTAFWTQCLIAAALALGIVSMAPWACAVAGYPQLVPHVCVAALALPLTALTTVQLAQFEREFDSRATAAVRLPSIAISSLIALALAATGFGLWSLIAQQLLYALCGALIAWRLSAWRPRASFSARALRDLAGFSASVTAGAVVNVGRKQADKLVVGAAFGAAPLGMYSVAQRLVELITQVSIKTISQVALPVFSRLQGDPQRLRKAYAQSVQLTSGIAFGVFPWLAVSAHDVVGLTLGARWLGMAPVLQILALHGVFSALLSVDTALIHASGRSLRRLLLNLLRFALTMAAYALFIDQGLLVVCAVGLAATLLVMPLELADVNRTLGLTYRDHARHLWPALVAASVGVATVLLLRELATGAWESRLARLSVETLAAGLVYCGLLLLTNRALIGAARDLLKVRALAAGPKP